MHYNVERLLLSSISSIFANPPKDKFEIIVVDNSNSTKLHKKIKKLNKKIRVIAPGENIGFGKGCNLGEKSASGEYLLFINPDTKVTKSALNLMLDKIKEDRKIGVLGPRLVSGSGKALPSISSKLTRISNLVVFSFFNKLWKTNPVSKKFWLHDLDRTKLQDVGVVSGACMMIPRNIFEKVKGFDENFFMYFEEHDICLRIKKKGYKVIYYPKPKIVHLIGQSLTNKQKIQNYLEKSRFQYSEKYFGKGYAVISELIIRLFKADTVAFLLLVAFSLFVNTYKIYDLMLFIGDMARDYLVAKDWIYGGQMPIVGIPSSVTWLHQGPISQWLVTLALKVSDFDPVSPAVLFGTVNAFTSGLIFILGKKYFGRGVGVFASLLYLTSPIVVANARMPYHTALVPFFTILFFLSLPRVIKDPSKLWLSSFLFGLLLLVELSNIVILGVMIGLFIIYRVGFSPKQVIYSLAAFLTGILPFVFYDLVHGPTYLRFPIWIVYRFIKSIIGENTQAEGLVDNFLTTFYQQVSGSILPQMPQLSLLIFAAAIALLTLKTIKYKKNTELILLLWLIVPIVSFFIHNAPGTAYFALLYPAIIVAAALLIRKVLTFKYAILVVSAFLILNISFLFKNNFFVNAYDKVNPMPPTGYNFGNTWTYTKLTSEAIVRDANGRRFQLVARGGLTLYKTSLDPYIFMIWKSNGNITKSAALKYYISQASENKVSDTFIYKNFQDIVSK